MTRHGVSILEVLFSILIVTVGLLGAVSVFTVAGAYSRKATIADSGSAIGRSAYHHFDVRGMRDPSNWVEWNAAAGGFRPALVRDGEAYCIDARFIADNLASASDAAIFPYVPRASVSDPRMRRISISSGIAPNTPMTKLMADAVFLATDDIVALRPDDRSLPAEGEFSNGVRQTEGMYSWFATVVPVLDGYDATDQGGQYVLSIVVCHQRTAVMLDTDLPGTELYDLPERVLGVSFPGGGTSGGEVLLTSPNRNLLKLRPGMWLCLARTATQPRPILGPNFTWLRTSSPLGFRWYRLSDVSDPSDDDGDGTFECYASLIGPDWDSAAAIDVTLPTDQVDANGRRISQTERLDVQHRAFIVESAVAVFEKTIALEH